MDTSSLDALVFAARRLREDRVALVAAARTPDVPAALRAARLPELRLAPLDARRRTRARRQRRRQPLGRAALDRIVELAEGVPLALVELAALGEDAAQHPEFAGGVVERLFGERIERLSGAAATAALVAALEEPDAAEPILRAAAALGAAAAAWEEAERASVLRLRAGRIDFEHPLLRAAVAAAPRRPPARAAHAALAEAHAARRTARPGTAPPRPSARTRRSPRRSSAPPTSSGRAAATPAPRRRSSGPRG